MFKKALEEEALSDEEYSSFLGRMYLFLGKLYRKIQCCNAMASHVQRNVNTPLFQAAGPDSGGDCIGDLIPGKLYYCGFRCDSSERRSA